MYDAVSRSNTATDVLDAGGLLIYWIYSSPRSRDIAACIVTRLVAGRYGIRILAGAIYFVFLQNVQTGSLSRGQSDRGVALTIHPHLAPLFKKG